MTQALSPGSMIWWSSLGAIVAATASNVGDELFLVGANEVIL
jgi:hypothetical protein